MSHAIDELTVRELEKADGRLFVVQFWLAIWYSTGICRVLFQIFAGRFCNSESALEYIFTFFGEGFVNELSFMFVFVTLLINKVDIARREKLFSLILWWLLFHMSEVTVAFGVLEVWHGTLLEVPVECLATWIGGRDILTYLIIDGHIGDIQFMGYPCRRLHRPQKRTWLNDDLVKAPTLLMEYSFKYLPVAVAWSIPSGVKGGSNLFLKTKPGTALPRSPWRTIA